MLATVATFYGLLDAQLFKAFLESRDITCFLTDEHLVSIQYSVAVGGVKVNVHTQQLEQAKKFYDEFQLGVNDEINHAVVCPNCGSDATMLLPAEKTIYYNEYRCFSCDHEWNDRHIHNINPGHIE